MTGRLTVLFVCAQLWGAASARADAVIDWNLITSEAIGKAMGAGRPGQTTILDFAMVHLAVHDAVQAIEKRFEPYQVAISPAKGSQAAAAAKAAHDVLAKLFPEQAGDLGRRYEDYFASHGLAHDDPGVLVGQQAAAGIIARRENDGRYPAGAEAFTGGTEAGKWRPTPPQQVSMAVPWLSVVRPFALNSPSQFRADPPPPLTSDRYARDYDEVKALGGSRSARTPEQTDLAYFWAANYGAVWNRAIRDIAGIHVKTIGDSARLFALANVATADATISSWDSKRHYVYWRPITAIQEGENDGNPRTIGDQGWQPLVGTPNYPDYTSGANNVTAAMTRILALFFGTENMPFSVGNDMTQATRKTRTYKRFSDASDEVVEARIWRGDPLPLRRRSGAEAGQGRGEMGLQIGSCGLSDADDVAGFSGRISSRRQLSGLIAQLFDRAADLHRRIEDAADGDAALQTVTADRFESRRRNAPAVGAIRIAAELARRDPCAEVRRKAFGRLGEDAFLRRLRRVGVHLEHSIDQLQLGDERAQPAHLVDDAHPVCFRQALGRDLALLRRVKAEPDRLCLLVRLPEPQELLQIPVALHLLACDGAVHGDLVPRDVLEDAIVGRRRAPHVVLRLQAVDRHHQLQTAQRRPFSRDRAHGARHELCVNAAPGKLGQDPAELAIAHQRLAADDRHVQGLVTIDQRHETADELVALDNRRGRAASRRLRGARRRMRNSPGSAAGTPS